MTLNDLMLALRSRLRDENSDMDNSNKRNIKWSDNELIDSINNAYIHLARVLRLFMQTKEYKVTNNTLIQELPTNFLDIHSIECNNNTIAIVRLHTHKHLRHAVSINTNKIHFRFEGTYSMHYYCYFNVVAREDELLLSDISFNTLLYYALYNLLQKKPHKEGLRDSAYFKSLYDEELKLLKQDIYRQRNTKHSVSHFILV